MNRSQLFRSSLRALSRYRLRSALIIVGNLIGVAALTLVMSVGAGAQHKIVETVGRLFSASTLMVTSGGGMPLSGPRSDSARLTIDDMQAVAAQLPNIDVWDPVQAMEAEARFGQAHSTIRVLGLSERSERVWSRSVTRGEYFDASAVKQSARVALIGQTVVRQLFPNQDPIDAEILIGKVPFRVIGVLESFGTDAHGMDRDNEVVVPISTAMRRLLNVDVLRGAKVLVKNPAEASQTALEMKRILRERHAIGQGQPDDFTIMTPVEVQAMVSRAKSVFALFLPLVSAAALIAGAVLAAAVMLMSIKSRVIEIGIRRAVGARPCDIAWQMILETTITTLIGGVAGILLGVLGASLLATRFDLPEFLSLKAIGIGFSMSALAGLCAGVIPARRAARLSPCQALRQ